MLNFEKDMLKIGVETSQADVELGILDA